MMCRIILPNSLYGHLMPPEDASVFDGSVVAVGDGITRDPSYDMDFKKRGIEGVLKGYPNPSGARFAADIFCDVFVRDGRSVENPADIKKTFLKANAEIARLNRKSINEVDYLVDDYYGCAAAGIRITGNRMIWGVIADCGVKVWSKKGNPKFKTPNTMAIFEKKVAEGKIKFKWETKEGRRLVRSQYRNNPAQIIDGECVSYGALTGEKTSEPFILTGQHSVAKGDLVIVYSDGFEPLLERPDFFESVYDKSESVFEQKLVPYSLRYAKKDYEKYGKERSLVALIV